MKQSFKLTVCDGWKNYIFLSLVLAKVVDVSCLVKYNQNGFTSQQRRWPEFGVVFSGGEWNGHGEWGVDSCNPMADLS